MCFINFTCPTSGLINATQECNLTVVSNSELFMVNLDFHDGDQRNITIIDETIKVLKLYQKPSVYNITSIILNNGLGTILKLNGKYK